MKKFTLVFLIILVQIGLFGQIGGTKVDGSYTAKDRTIFKEGDTIKLGIGTMDDGSFKYIYQPANYLIGTPERHISSASNGLSYEIKELRKLGTKRNGYKTVAIIKTSLINGVIDIESAIASNEIITMNNQVKSESNKPVLSVADELLKLKQLLDAGAITQEEYDSQKKKLLEKQ